MGKAKYDKTYYQENKEKILQRKRKLYQENKEERREKQREYHYANRVERNEYSKKYHALNGDRHKERCRKADLKRKFNITIEDYDILFEKQNGCCGICNNPQEKFEFRLAVDHDHETGEVRGLLCSRCNLGLAKFGDNIEGIMKVVKYLKKE